MITQYICFARITDTETNKVFYDVYVTDDLGKPYEVCTKDPKSRYLINKYIQEGKANILQAEVLQFFTSRAEAIEYMINHVTETYTA